MERQTELVFGNSLNRDANQTIFLLTFLNCMQATSNHEINNHSENIHFHIRDRLTDLGYQDLKGPAELS